MATPMNALLPFVILGITAGSVYGLTGTGLVLTYKTSGIFNFAQGAVATTGAYVLYILHGDVLHLPAVPTALICVFVVGPVLDRIGGRRPAPATASPFGEPSQAGETRVPAAANGSGSAVGRPARDRKTLAAGLDLSHITVRYGGHLAVNDQRCRSSVAVILAPGIRAPVIFSGSKSSASGRNAGGRLCTKLSTPSVKSGPLFSTSITAYERRQASSNEASRSASTW